MPISHVAFDGLPLPSSRSWFELRVFKDQGTDFSSLFCHSINQAFYWDPPLKPPPRLLFLPCLLTFLCYLLSLLPDLDLDKIIRFLFRSPLRSRYHLWRFLPSPHLRALSVHGKTLLRKEFWGFCVWFFWHDCLILYDDPLGLINCGGFFIFCCGRSGSFRASLLRGMLDKLFSFWFCCGCSFSSPSSQARAYF